MLDHKTLIEQVYGAFNRRDINGALALMATEVSWPKASEGGTVLGKDAIRAYWTRQWSEFDPRVEPLEISDEGPGKTLVRVHQLVRDLAGKLLSDSEVTHVYTITDGLITRMELGGSDGAAGETKSSAFVRRA